MMAARRRESGDGMDLSTLLAGHAVVPTAIDRPVTALVQDSRAAVPGAVFLALPGTRVRGIEFAAEAVRRGAVAVLCLAPDFDAELARQLGAAGGALVVVEDLSARAGAIASRFFGEPSEDMRVVGVTGTDGKTSVSHLLAQVLDHEPGHCALFGTLGYGRVGQLQPFGLTTPDAVVLQARLAELAARGVRHAVMEVSSHALDQYRVDGTRLAAAVLTNLGRDHLDYHGDQRTYGETKARLFRWPRLPVAVLNADDEFARSLAARLPRGVRALGFALSEAALGSLDGVYPTAWRAHARGVEIDLPRRFGGARLHSPLLGDFNVGNLLAALATLLALDVPLHQAVPALAHCRPIPGRMETVPVALPCTVVVDYAHTPQALERALAALRPLTSGQLWCVFGCGGERDRGKRPLMGAIAAAGADEVLITDDNPRGEDPAVIARDIVAGMDDPGRAQVVRPREQALRAALSAAGAGDMVLVAGKGHEPYQLLGDERLAFDDRAVVRRLAAEIGA